MSSAGALNRDSVMGEATWAMADPPGPPPEEPEAGDPPEHASLAQLIERGLSDLREEIGRLQRSVELLGCQGFRPAALPPGPADPRAPGSGDHAPGAEADAGLYSAPLPPPPPAAWEQPFDPPPAEPPPPVGTSGHATEPARAAARPRAAVIVAGPFGGLIDLRHLEDDLAALASVSDVRVRRFGHGRARIEVTSTGPAGLGHELQMLGRSMEISEGTAGEIVIELTAPPEEPLADPGVTVPGDDSPLEHRQAPA